MTISNEAPKAHLRDVMAAVLAEFPHLDRAALTSPQRARRIARPRQIAFALSRELTPASLPKIGQMYGGRDHTTVLHGVRRIKALCDDGDTDLELTVHTIRQRILGALQPDEGEATGFKARVARSIAAGVTVQQLIEQEEAAA